MLGQKTLKTEGVRNPAIELYRIVLMFGICLLHSITMCGHENPRISELLFPCVNGFVFISGWFGINFRVKKLTSLVLNAVYAGTIVVLLAWLFAPDMLSLSHECLRKLKYVFAGQWFCMSYIALMLVSPAINHIIDGLNRDIARKFILPFVLLVGWNWCSEIHFVSRIVPAPGGFGSYTPLSLAITYISARLMRKYDVLKMVSTWFVVTVASVLSALFFFAPIMNLAGYASPLAIVYAAVFFKLFEGIPISPLAFVGRAVTAMSPSMFSVYLLHTNCYGFALMTNLENGIIHCCGCVACSYVATAIFVFVACIILDAPRRLVLSAWRIVKLR